jgi:2-polyprenyl-3-methyl-5-hydroxy-6-metoxy-1,4-benzoquinol methylase
MDIRPAVSGWPPAVAAGALDRFNHRHPWSHNDHFHPWIESKLPARRRLALDIGCGRGELLTRLAPRFDQMVGIDVDRTMCAAATQRCREAGTSSVEVRCATLEELALEPQRAHRFDLITMVAVLHHLPLVPALDQVRQLLAPGGRLLVVGLARAGSVPDVAVDLASAVVNPVVGLARHPQAVRGPSDPPPFPVKEPAETYEDIRLIAEWALPGARIRRRLFFRYTLEWTAPAEPGRRVPLARPV